MSPDVESALVSRFPFLHSLWHGHMECGDGWSGIIERLCQAIQDLPPPEGFRVVQVKEKFAALRFYCEPEWQELWDLVEAAESESRQTCENCGSTEGVSQIAMYGWLFTRCKGCISREWRGDVD